MYKNLVKPFFDLVGALLATILLSPIFLIVILGLAVANGGNPFFLQRRPGKNGKIFTIIKFKTMNDRCDIHGKLLPDSQRLTAIGKIVRKTSIDELPQLLNVLKGEMSFVGPRPLLPEYLSLYSAEQQKRHKVCPGITGWAQIQGRNAISWTQKLSLDVWYVENQTYWLDIKILFLTIKKVVVPEGINAEGQATTVKFNGKN